MKLFKLFAAIFAVCLVIGAAAVPVAAVTEKEILETVYELEKDKMTEPHNGFSFMVEQRSDGKMLDAVYTDVDVWGGTDRWYAPDTSICIIGYDFMHPSNSCRPVLVWTAPYDGKIGVYTKYSALKDGDDTTEISLRLNDRTIWKNVTSTAEEVENDTFEVKAGDRVMWVVDCITDQTNDTTNTVRRVWYTEVNLNGKTETSVESSEPEASATVSESETTEAPSTTVPETEEKTRQTAPATDSETGKKPSDSGGSSTGIIIGVIAAVVVAAAVCVIVFVSKKKKV